MSTQKIKELLSSVRNTEHQNRIAQEIEILEKRNLIDKLLNRYYRVHEKPSLRGNKNELNLLCAFLLGITSKKPDLAKPPKIEARRTYARPGFPDIDMDFDYYRRHEIMEYITEKYGADKVAHIGAVQRLKIKAALRRVIKALDPENNTVFDKDGKAIKSDTKQAFQLENLIIGSLPKDPILKRADGSIIKDIQEAYDEYSEFRKYMDEYPEVFRVAKKIEGCISAYSSHAGGVVISPEPLESICPLHLTRGVTKTKEIATQFAMEDVEYIGLIKFDVLGISTKTAISESIKLIQARHNVVIDPSNLPLSDKRTFKLLSSGRTDLVFQCENGGMKKCLQEVGVDSFYDIMTITAMYRPGPMDYIPDLIKRKKKQVPVVYAHPTLENILNKTYGIMIFQEDIMRCFVELSGLTNADGYNFIKGCAKKKPEIIAGYKDKFLKGCQQNGITNCEKIWPDFEKTAGYSFGKNHSAAYAYECYKTAWLKANYTIEFFAARLSVESKRRKFEVVEKYENDAEKYFGIKILPVDLNHSKLDYTIVGENQLLRPIIVEGIGDAAAQEIVDCQPFEGKDKLFTFATKTGQAVNAKTMEALCRVGIWKPLKNNEVMTKFDMIRKDVKKSKGMPTGDMFE